MKIKILYALTSTDKDIYMEQLWVSVTSLRMYNPVTTVVLLMDKITYEGLIGYRAKLLDLIDESIVVPTPDGYSQKEVSRYIKTTARQWVKGDFLFIDTDTVITGDLSDVDKLEGDVLLCPEFHESLKNNPMSTSLIDRVKQIFDTDISDAPNYYNSGIILCRDTEFAHKFYKQWNENWTKSLKDKNVNFDQPALAKTDHDLGYAIKELDGQYHCQIFLSIKYLYRAKIIHFFNMTWFKDAAISPFLTKDLYMNVKNKGFIDDETLFLIKNVKNQFPAISVTVCRKEFELLVDYGKSLMTIMVKPDTKLKKFCKFMIEKVIRVYWIFQRF